MGRWSETGVKCWIPKSSEIEVGQITHFHNVDCDAYEKRIAELEALVGRVKAESLRVVVDPDSDEWVMTPDGLGWYGEDAIGNPTIETPHGYHDFADCKPVRLERWETAE